MAIKLGREGEIIDAILETNKDTQNGQSVEMTVIRYTLGGWYGRLNANFRPARTWWIR